MYRIREVRRGRRSHSGPLEQLELSTVHNLHLSAESPQSNISHSPLNVTHEVEDSPIVQQSESRNHYVDFLGQKSTIEPNGKYTGESSNLGFFVSHRDQKQQSVLHYPLPHGQSFSRTIELDSEDMDILRLRGAFLLPPRELCDELVDCFFQRIHPILPIINRTDFMKRYGDLSANPPSLLLLQSIFLAGSRVSKSAALIDPNTGSTNAASLTFWKRAKALFDADFEEDKVAIVQSLLVLSWWWEGPEDVTKNVYYWIGVAIRIAQGIGMHRSVRCSRMAVKDQQLWRRIWWTCFSRDRMAAVALGRPMMISTEDSDVEMLTEQDFVEEQVGPNQSLMYPPIPLHVQFFINHIKLCEIMGLVLSRQYTVASRRSPQKDHTNLMHSDMALAGWVMNLPPELRYSTSSDPMELNYWAAILHSIYFTTLCLLHRPHIGKTGSNSSYPSMSIAHTAAVNLTRLFDRFERLPVSNANVFSVYSLFSAMIFHVVEIRSASLSVVEAAQNKLDTCMKALKELSKVWSVGQMVYRLFEVIQRDDGMKERMREGVQKHAQTRYAGRGTNDAQGLKRKAKAKESSRKRVPTGSYPMMPSTLSPGTSPTQGITPPVSISNGIPSVQGATLGGKAPLSPFVGKFEFSANAMTTPPEMFLVTKTCPFPDYLWENYQPTCLFPDEPLNRDSLQVHPGMAMPQQATSSPSEGNTSSEEKALDGLPPSTLNIDDWYQYFGLETDFPEFDGLLF
ncbi:Cutinase transcription factor 1 alpha [Neolecta irregularis DAH-3]|uniref:Cutinase transcription factor 1 alpha n=1 Tax=Neolecta irregularis (strain DAH-3) TaxID=1198029 RepID=A0A1U7LH69_NEOID|nr:Cutinase transcription factor 1 alpha [Neolecta irregularis DAH-3]|eukprot:OLL21943.1 Cutinase transcription factor 1 alpha [Neolecta irregularis DAH-3]